jgi:hypothetical protein
MLPPMAQMSAMLTLSQDLLSETDLTPQQLTELAVELRQAVRECKDRGLLSAAKWYVSPCDRDTVQGS